MSALKQIAAVTAMSLRYLPQRLGTSSVIVIGIAGVVAVLISMLAMATGFTETMSHTGRADRVIVLRGGSGAEINSSVSRDAALTIADAAGVKTGPDGKPVVSAEAIVLIQLPYKRGDSGANVTLRGVGPEGFALRPEVKLIEGRMFRPGVRELIVGKSVLTQFDGVAVGSQIHFRDSDWTVVGSFESGGDSHESEMLADAQTVLSAYRRNIFSSVTAMLDAPESFDKFRAALTANPALSVDVKRESDYYGDQSKQLATVLSYVAYGVGGIMAIGALFGALNTMYSAVSARALEIATLRAIGFGAGAVVISVFVESLFLALIGAVVGALLAWLLFNGHSLSTSATSLAQTEFALIVTPAMIALGIVWAIVIGLIGGLFPAIRAARLPVATALRAI